MSLDILKKYRIKAKKSLGQNFLVNNFILEEISNIIEIKDKNIIEVGPGYGALTEKIIARAPKSLNLVELDNDMVFILEKRKNNGDFDLDGIDFKINNTDILKYFPGFDSYSVIANIPYYITSPILRHFLYDVQNKPKNMLILMQKDVGDKILLGQKKIRSSVLSLFIAKKTNVKEVLFVGKENFVPAPKIESSVLLFKSHNLYKDIDDNLFLNIIKKGFSSPRKKLMKNLINGGFKKEVLESTFNKLGLDFGVRGENLSIENWCRLVNKL